MAHRRSNNTFGWETLTGRHCSRKRWKLRTSLSKMQKTSTRSIHQKKMALKEMTPNRCERTPYFCNDRPFRLNLTDTITTRMVRDNQFQRLSCASPKIWRNRKKYRNLKPIIWHLISDTLGLWFETLTSLWWSMLTVVLARNQSQPHTHVQSAWTSLSYQVSTAHYHMLKTSVKYRMGATSIIKVLSSEGRRPVMHYVISSPRYL